ncbi:MAG: type II toxin-antitoxin system HigB family toxin [Isosphaeraceae bacterium]
MPRTAADGSEVAALGAGLQTPTWVAALGAGLPTPTWSQPKVVVRKARWRNFSDLRATFGNADQVEKFVVFNIGGNKYRLIAQIYYQDAVILIRRVLTHKEYDKGDWKSGSGHRG